MAPISPGAIVPAETLILGASGQLGSAFHALLEGAMVPSRSDFDLEATDLIADQISKLRPGLIINCAAYTAVDAAESDEDRATVINGDAVGELAAAADRLSVPLVTFSTDYVFDGQSGQPYHEGSAPEPINAYGRSKLAGEQAARRFRGSLIIRTSWMFSATHPNFVTAILGKAESGRVRVVDDQWGRPTSARRLASATLEALSQGFTGTLHLASPPTTSWFGLAQAIFQEAQLDRRVIEACRTEDLNRAANRPRFSALESRRGVVMADWHQDVSETVWTLRSQEMLPGN